MTDGIFSITLLETQDKGITFFKIKIQNNSAEPLNGCGVILKSMTDKDGHESKQVGSRFRCSKDESMAALNPDENPDHPKTFDVLPNSSELINILFWDPENIYNTDPTALMSNVDKIRICYALTPGIRVNLGGVRSKCPYSMILQVSAINSAPKFIEIGYDVDSEGNFKAWEKRQMAKV